LGAVAQAELAEHPAHMGLDRLLAEEQATGDLGVRQAFGDEPDR
jgi:hypothetical protein